LDAICILVAVGLGGPKFEGAAVRGLVIGSLDQLVPEINQGSLFGAIVHT
jgi:hypothetical protein